MSASHPALQDHAQAAADAFSQRYVQPRARKGRRGGSSSGIDLCRLGREPDSNCGSDNRNGPWGLDRADSRSLSKNSRNSW